jgi:hypothetical protein
VTRKWRNTLETREKETPHGVIAMKTWTITTTLPHSPQATTPQIGRLVVAVVVVVVAMALTPSISPMGLLTLLHPTFMDPWNLLMTFHEVAGPRSTNDRSTDKEVALEGEVEVASEGEVVVVSEGATSIVTLITSNRGMDVYSILA